MNPSRSPVTGRANPWGRYVSPNCPGRRTAALKFSIVIAGGAWADRLRGIDSMIVAAGHGGSSTAVVVELVDGAVFGASVGDSGAWIVIANGVIDLTERQVRKPLLGTGLAEPVAFGPVPLLGRLIVGTDGLFKYVGRARLTAVALEGSADVAAGALVDAVRLKSGRFQDDLAVVICEGTG